MSDQDGTGTTALIQSFTVPSDSQVILSFDIFVDNQNTDINDNPVFYDPASLDSMSFRIRKRTSTSTSSRPMRAPSTWAVRW
jgi:hypothetical protein